MSDIRFGAVVAFPRTAGIILSFDGVNRRFSESDAMLDNLYFVVLSALAVAAIFWGGRKSASKKRTGIFDFFEMK
ncbi:MAG: hypothetical protein ACTHLR_00665 [Rhizomicrobium sp.]